MERDFTVRKIGNDFEVVDKSQRSINLKGGDRVEVTSEKYAKPQVSQEHSQNLKYK